MAAPFFETAATPRASASMLCDTPDQSPGFDSPTSIVFGITIRHRFGQGYYHPGMLGPSAVLLVVAAPAEARAVLRAFGTDPSRAESPWVLHTLSKTFDLVISCIGKANAAGAAAKFGDPRRHAAILSAGIAGALPGSGVDLGTSVAADACVFADEGLLSPSGFTDCAAMGFPLADLPGSGVPVPARLVDWLRPAVNRVGPIATVSTCSGTDGMAAEVRARTGALAEGMEGAAVALIGRRIGIPAGEVRIVSNTTGDRERQVWDVKKALAGLELVMGRLAESAPAF